MWIVSHKVGEFVFEMSGMGGREDGVIFSPKYHDITNPDVLEAFKVAVTMYPDIAEIHNWIESRHYSERRDTLYEGQLLQRHWSVKYGYPNEALTQYIDRITSIQAEPPKPSRKRSPGWIYILKSDHGYKIGYSKNPENRLVTFGNKLPFPVEYECLFQVEDMRITEKYLHELYAHKRIDGEWFDLTADDIETIKTIDIEAFS